MFHARAPSGIRLRAYQVRAIQLLEELLAGDKRHLLLVAPTGSGKTTIAAQLVYAAWTAGKRCLFLAHRRELVNQAYKRLLDFGIPEQQLGVLMASDDRHRSEAPIQIGSVATVHRRIKPFADLVIEDECHRMLARTHRELAEHYADAVRVGLTATPCRADSQSLGDVYEALISAATPRELMEVGYLVEPEIHAPTMSWLPELGKVPLRGTDYDERALAKLVDTDRLVGDVVEQWLTHAYDLRTLVFATSIDHSRRLAHRFRRAGAAAEHLDGTMRIIDRDAVLVRLAQGLTQVICSVAILCEGFDQASVKCIVLARPTKSLGLYLQQVGRALRPWRGTRAVILDHAGCIREHGLPHAPRNFALAA